MGAAEQVAADAPACLVLRYEHGRSVVHTAGCRIVAVDASILANDHTFSRSGMREDRANFLRTIAKLNATELAALAEFVSHPGYYTFNNRWVRKQLQEAVGADKEPEPVVLEIRRNRGNWNVWAGADYYPASPGVRIVVLDVNVLLHAGDPAHREQLELARTLPPALKLELTRHLEGWETLKQTAAPELG